MRDSTNPQPEVSLKSSKHWDFKSIGPYCREATTCQTNPPNLVDNQFLLPEKVIFRETDCFCNDLNDQFWRKGREMLDLTDPDNVLLDLEDVVPPDCFWCRPWSHSCRQGLLRKVVPPYSGFLVKRIETKNVTCSCCAVQWRWGKATQRCSWSTSCILSRLAGSPEDWSRLRSTCNCCSLTSDSGIFWTSNRKDLGTGTDYDYNCGSF